MQIALRRWVSICATRVALAATFLLLSAPLVLGAVSGKVLNRTTGQPAGGVFVTLLKFENGMDPVEEVQTKPDGTFAFEKEIVAAGGGPVAGGLRVDYQGVSYSEMLPPGRPTTGLEISVYSVEENETLNPSGRVFILEPGGSEMVVSESYAFLNESSPPRAYRNPLEGTLRFWLPPEAKGIVQVSTSGPQGMPLRSVAQPAGEENVYKVDFALKPGENSINLTYLVPYSGKETFRGRSLYPDVPTRLAAPAGVSLTGENVVVMGQEPKTQATVYQIAANGAFEFEIAGQGQLARAASPSEPASSSGGGGDIRIAPAPVAKELYWILGLTTAILGAGFLHLYTARSKEEAAVADPVSSERESKPASRSRLASVPRKE
jgi:hypothetical protein